MSIPVVIPPEISLQLRKQEDRVVANAADSVQARCEFGHAVLPLRVGEQLPRGMLARLTAEYKIGKSELLARMQFATRYKPDEVSTLMETYPTWKAIKEHLVQKPRRPKVANPVRRIVTLLDALDYRNLTKEDRQQLVTSLTAASKALKGDAKGKEAA